MFRSLACLCLLAWLAFRPAAADIDPAEYQLRSSVRSEEERRRLLTELEADRQREAQEQRQEEEIAERLQGARQAAREALPYPVRLTETRCTGCHGAENYASNRHNRIGWEMVILRMQHLNSARLEAGERGVIAAHLARTLPTRGGAALAEALQQLLAALTPVWVWIAWKAIRSARHHDRVFASKPGVFR